MMEESGGKLPPLLINSMELKKEKMWKSQKENGEKNRTYERKEKGEERKRKIFPAFRWSKLDSPRIKVGPRNEGFVWVQKSGSFVKL